MFVYMKSQYSNLFVHSFSSDDQMTEKSYQSLHPSFGRSLPISLGRHLKIIGCDISFHQMICKVEKQQCSKNSKILQATILVYSIILHKVDILIMLEEQFLHKEKDLLLLQSQLEDLKPQIILSWLRKTLTRLLMKVSDYLQECLLMIIGNFL